MFSKHTFLYTFNKHHRIRAKFILIRIKTLGQKNIAQDVIPYKFQFLNNVHWQSNNTDNTCTSKCLSGD